jgi:hypothetical protein
MFVFCSRWREGSSRPNQSDGSFQKMKEDSSFSEEKEAKRLLILCSFAIGHSAAAKVLRFAGVFSPCSRHCFDQCREIAEIRGLRHELPRQVACRGKIAASFGQQNR